MLKKSNRFLKLLKPLKNIYFLILIVFIVWMVVFDANSWLIHSDLNEDIEDLNSKIEFYNGEIEKDKKDFCYRCPGNLTIKKGSKLSLNIDNDNYFIFDKSSGKRVN